MNIDTSRVPMAYRDSLETLLNLIVKTIILFNVTPEYALRIVAEVVDRFEK